jgi:hypothetical protein
MSVIYPIELEIKDTTDTAGSDSYINLHLYIYMREKIMMGTTSSGISVQLSDKFLFASAT